MLDTKNAVGALPEIGLCRNCAMADGGGAQRVAAQARCEHARTRWDQLDVAWRGAVDDDVVYWYSIQ